MLRHAVRARAGGSCVTRARLPRPRDADARRPLPPRAVAEGRPLPRSAVAAGPPTWERSTGALGPMAGDERRPRTAGPGDGGVLGGGASIYSASFLCSFQNMM